MASTEAPVAVASASHNVKVVDRSLTVENIYFRLSTRDLRKGNKCFDGCKCLFVLLIAVHAIPGDSHVDERCECKFDILEPICSVRMLRCGFILWTLHDI